MIALFDFKRHFHRQSSGLKTAPMRVLSRIAQEGQIQTLDLGRLCDTPPATLIGLLDDLESKGLIERVRSRTDKRVVLVSATDAGEAVAARREDEERLFRKNIVRGLNHGERRELEALLTKLFDGIGDGSGLFKE
ncbi:MAG: MarR family transcriptional regulator [Spirochaetes bacterium]|nr:MarR family transcriptional regulator [Spirochaetota bacterium]MBU1079764.1 MarR family transcriptional regulator [Spirochaetota bacterium]